MIDRILIYNMYKNEQIKTKLQMRSTIKVPVAVPFHNFISSQ